MVGMQSERNRWPGCGYDGSSIPDRNTESIDPRYGSDQDFLRLWVCVPCGRGFAEQDFAQGPVKVILGVRVLAEDIQRRSANRRKTVRISRWDVPRTIMA